MPISRSYTDQSGFHSLLSNSSFSIDQGEGDASEEEEIVDGEMEECWGRYKLYGALNVVWEERKGLVSDFILIC